MNKLKIKHIFHSGFEVQYEDIIILFDVYNNLEGYKNKKIYCFSTHSHGDHYSPDMLDLRNKNEVHYIFSSDIDAEGHDITFVNEGDEINTKRMQIKVFGTTDLGVSFYVKLDDVTLFHSGDLNWWHWDNDTDDVKEAEKIQFQTEINRLIGLPIDFAFVPVDPRLNKHNRLAMDYVIETLKPKYLIPMHFGTQYDSIHDIETDSDTILLKSKSANSFIY